MHWQDRVRQALKRKDIEIALHEFSLHQQKKPDSKDPSLTSTDRKLKRSKVKRDDQDTSAHLTPSSSDAGSDTGHLSDEDLM